MNEHEKSSPSGHPGLPKNPDSKEEIGVNIFN